MIEKMTIARATLIKTNLYLATSMPSIWFEHFEGKSRQLKGSLQLISETESLFNVFAIIVKVFTKIRGQLMPAA